MKDAELVWTEDVRNAGGEIVFARGSYNNWNVWNTLKGAMHLTHRANTLGPRSIWALMRRCSFPCPNRPPHAAVSVDCCAQFGGVNRSSDPLIGAGVNGLARSGLAVTLDNPVGLYIQDVGSADCAIPLAIRSVRPHCVSCARVGSPSDPPPEVSRRTARRSHWISARSRGSRSPEVDRSRGDHDGAVRAGEGHSRSHGCPRNIRAKCCRKRTPPAS